MATNEISFILITYTSQVYFYFLISLPKKSCTEIQKQLKFPDLHLDWETCDKIPLLLKSIGNVKSELHTQFFLKQPCKPFLGK